MFATRVTDKTMFSNCLPMFVREILLTDGRDNEIDNVSSMHVM